MTSDPFGGQLHYNGVGDEIAYIGTQIDILWSPPVTSTTASGTFTLGDDITTGTNYDVNGDGVDEVAPFKDKMIFITGMRIVAPTGGSCSVGKVSVDGFVIMAETLPAGSVWALDGAALPPTGPTTSIARGPNISDRFGGPIEWRHQLILRKASTDAIANSQANATVHIYGIMVDRFF